MSRLPITATIITLNEAANLAETIHALAFVDEVLVVDAGSSDGTQALAQQLGATVHHQPFLGYGAQKNHAASLARNPWILNIDADETVSPALAAEIVQLFTAGQPAGYVYSIPRALVFMGHTFAHSRESRQRQVRLYAKGSAAFAPVAVHEAVQSSLPVAKLRGIALHRSYASIAQYLATFNAYTTKGAVALVALGKRASLLWIALRLPLDFIKLYLLQGNFLEGWPGFYWALLSSWYPVVKYLKVWESDQ